MKSVIGTVFAGGTLTDNRRADVTIERNGSGIWTATGPHAMRDFASRGRAVRWLKTVFADESNRAEWSE